MLKRAEASSTIEGLGDIANTVATSAVSRVCAATNLVATAMIRLLIASTEPEAYAASCRALASSPHLQGSLTGIDVHIIGGEEDYLATPQMVATWAEEVGGTHEILSNVGHWGAIEAPIQVGKAIARFMAPL